MIKRYVRVMGRFVLAYVILLIIISNYSYASDYIIGEGDGLEVSVWGVKDLNFAVKVRPDGKITVPGIGDVNASGLSTSELQKVLRNRLKDIVKEPIVTVTVKEILNNKVYVFGSGVKPGVYELSRKTTLLQLLCSVGDLKLSDLDNAYLLRSGKKVKINMHQLYTEGDLSQDMQLEVNDYLFIPIMGEKSIYVLGAVNNPKAIEFRDGITAIEAILDSGGFTKFAGLNDIIVKRNEAGKDIKIKVMAKDIIKKGDTSKNVKLKPGDYVIVPEDLF